MTNFTSRQPLPGATAALLPDLISDRANSSAQSNSPVHPTAEAYGDILKAYGHFNDWHFDGKLPDCVVTFNRQSPAGFVRPKRFIRADGETAIELAMNPLRFANRSDRETFSDIGRCQLQIWRWEFGPPNRKGGRGSSGYADKVLIEAMRRIGLELCPRPKRGDKNPTLQRIVEGGPFDRACNDLLATGFKINWAAAVNAVRRAPAFPMQEERKATRARFACPICGQLAWARATAAIDCGTCRCALQISDGSAT